MTRPYLNQNPTHETISSPGGFWPNPDKEEFCINDNRPWEVPKKRKPRGSKDSYFVDKMTGETIMSNRKIPEDQNRFALLDPDYVEDPPVCRYRLDSGDTLYQSYDEMFCSINNKFDIPDYYSFL